MKHGLPKKIFAAFIVCILVLPGVSPVFAAALDMGRAALEDGFAIRTSVTGAGAVTGVLAASGPGVQEEGTFRAQEGEEVKITAEPSEGYYLAQVRCQYEDGGQEVYMPAEKTDDGYTFRMPAGDTTVTADFVPVVWDGTIDLAWYDPDETEYDIRYAAQLAGAAALANGLFNNYPEKEAIVDGKTVRIPYMDALPEGTDVSGIPPAQAEGSVTGLPHGYNGSLYNVFSAVEGNAEKTVVIGNAAYLVAVLSSGTGRSDDDGDSGEEQKATTDDYYTGAQDFTGKTLRLTADLDMGGRYSGGSGETDKRNPANRSGPNYMPIGGQYTMDDSSAYTKLSASFNGTLDGQGHMVSNICCKRYGTGENYGDNQSVGLIGRMGVHDNDPSEWRTTPAVRNVAVSGFLYSRRSVGGIVGKTGKSNGAVVENCLNFATVVDTDSKGVGGIVGAGWNETVIKNCANFGYIYTSQNNAGGICGSCQVKVSSSYNFGYVGAVKESAGQALGTSSGGSVWRNCYYLKGSSISMLPGSTVAEGNQAVFGKGPADTVYGVDTAGEFKTAAFLERLNGESRDWVLSSTDNIVSAALQGALGSVDAFYYNNGLSSSYNAMGAAVPRAYTEDTAKISRLACDISEAKADYVEGQAFDKDTLKIWAEYDDNTKERLEDYEVVYQTGGGSFHPNDKVVTVRASYQGMSLERQIAVTVKENELTALRITKAPNKVFYISGEPFDPSGMAVKAEFSNGQTVQPEAVDLEYSPKDNLEAGVKEITVSYTYTNGLGHSQSLSCSQSVTVIGQSGQPEADEDGTFLIASAEQLLWFAEQIQQGNQINAALVADIDMTGDDSFLPIGWKSVGTVYYTGVFDGRGHTVTLDYASSGKANSALFAGIEAGAVIENVVVAGRISGGNYTAGIVAQSEGGKIRNCRNEAVLNGNEYVGGIVSRVMEQTDIENCRNASEDITAANYAGGIVGAVYGPGTLSGCGNEGVLNTTGQSASRYVGGIAGYVEAAVTIGSCCNAGTVLSGVTAGGIAGYVNHAQAKIQNCYNTGSVTGTAPGIAAGIGGIVGTARYRSLAMEHCYNAGSVAGASGNEAGALIGNRKQTGDAAASGNYALSGSADVLIGNGGSLSDANRFVTSEELKGLYSTLGAAYKCGLASKNSGYPLLAWQEATAEEVAAAISSIGTVTLASKDSLAAVRAAYDALDDLQKSQVSNIAELAEAESQYQALAKAEAERQAAEEAKRQAEAKAAEEARAAEEAKRQAEAKAEEEAKRQAEAKAAEEAKRQAEAKAAEEAKRQAEEEAKRKAEEEAKKQAAAKAAEEAKRQAEAKALAAFKNTTPKVKSKENVTSGITLKWGKVTGADGYKVYRKTGNGKWTLIKTVKGVSKVSYTDTKVKSKNGTTYRYAVRAYKGTALSKQSAAAVIVRLTAPSLKKPVNKSGKKVSLSWSRNKKAGGYQVVYATKKSFSGKKVKNITKSKTVSYTLSKLTKKKKYYIKIRSYKKVGKTTYYSAWSSVKTVTVKK